MADAHINALNSIEPDTLSEGQRRQTLDAAYALIKRLERPIDVVLQLVTTPAAFAALKALCDLKLFEKWAELGIHTPMTYSKLAELTGRDPVVISRLLRHLVSTGYLVSSDRSTVKTTRVTASLTEPGYRDMLPFLQDMILPSVMHLPKYLQDSGYKNPTDPAVNSFAERKGQGIFEYLKKHPEEAKNFNESMTMTNAEVSVPLVDLYPLDNLLKAEGVILVDVGGNEGHDLRKLSQLHDLPTDSLILQDLKAGLPSADSLPGAIKPMEHDFFTPQPVKGARAYYMHRVLHNWSDADVLKILGHLRDAMKPGYSSLLIHEFVATTSGAPSSSFTTTLDIIMMAALSGIERTDEMWEGLFEKAGLKLAKTYRSGADDILEVVLAA